MAALRRLQYLQSHLQASAAPSAASAVVETIQGYPEDAHAMPKYHHSPRFECNDPAFLEYLDAHGYAVIKNVLTEEEAAHGVSLAWEFMENLGTGIDRNNPATWGSDRWYPGSNPGGGIMGNFGVGQSAALWFVRANPKVQKVFETIWGTPDLLTSFDGFCLFRPWGLNQDWKTQGGRFHTDRSYSSKYDRPDRRHYVQGFCNLVQTSAAGMGNLVVPGSHLLYEELGRDFAGGENRVNVQSLNNDKRKKAFPNLYDNAICAHMEAGDFFLWDDRTLHCNSSGVGEARDVAELMRVACYVCMTPRAAVSEECRASREAAVRAGFGSGHTGGFDVPINMQGRSPTDAKNPQYKYAGLTWEELTLEQKKLVR